MNGTHSTGNQLQRTNVMSMKFHLIEVHSSKRSENEKEIVLTHVVTLFRQSIDGFFQGIFSIDKRIVLSLLSRSSNSIRIHTHTHR
jgi:hypothetical protein